MSKLSHSNPNLDDVLHDGNKHLALGKKAKSKPSSSGIGRKNYISIGPRGEGACDAFDRDFDAFCDGTDGDYEDGNEGDLS